MGRIVAHPLLGVSSYLLFMTTSFRLSALACASLATLSFSNAEAQSAAPGVPNEIVITGNPLGRDSTTVPVSTLGRADLLERGQGTLGETLNGLPGVSSTYFGPNASRPVIRGLDGDRIRVLNNSASSLDVSALSYDHAVPLDVLSTDRIEVLRGPAALLYGGSAVGGVVNVIDNRIPREAVSGVLGKAQLQAGTGNNERSVAGLLEAGNERFALHLDGFDRRTGDVRVPVSLACKKPDSPANARRICNAASSARGGAIGASTFWDHGYLGASVNSYQSDYGTVAEDQVTIGMKTTRYALEGQVRQLPGWLDSVKARLSHTDYQHTEFDEGVAGTVFANKGQDLRIEARHRPLAGWQGVLGVQTESSRFSAVGDESFAPFSRTRSQALFVHEERPTSWGQVTAGARWESVRVESLGNPELDRFDEGKGAKKFTPFSVAAGAVFKLSPTWSLTGNAAVTQRAPKDYELFANGPHLATNAWEIGQKDLGLEKSKSLDAGAQWKSGHNSLNVTAFASQFANYIGLMNTRRLRTVCRCRFTKASRPNSGASKPAADSACGKAHPRSIWTGVPTPCALRTAARVSPCRASHPCVRAQNWSMRKAPGAPSWGPTGTPSKSVCPVAVWPRGRTPWSTPACLTARSWTPRC